MDKLRITEQALSELAAKWSEDLKKDLAAAGHVQTGKLISSVNFIFNSTGTQFEIDLTSLEYLKYLEDGAFIERFTNKKREELKKVVGESAKKDLLAKIKEIQNKTNK